MASNATFSGRMIQNTFRKCTIIFRNENIIPFGQPEWKELISVFFNIAFAYFNQFPASANKNQDCI